MPLSKNSGGETSERFNGKKKESLNILEVICKQIKSRVWLTAFDETTKAGRSLEPLKSEKGKGTSTMSPCLNIHYF